MDKKPERPDRFANPEELQRFLRSLGLMVAEDVVRTVVRTLQGRSGLALFNLWAHGKTQKGVERRPICGKGTVDKIRRLYHEGKLDPYLAYLATTAVDQQEPSDQREESRSQRLDDVAPSPLVKLETNCEGYHLRPHSTASLLDPITVFPSVQNRGKEVIRYLQMHVWFPWGMVFWNPEAPDSGGWRDEGFGGLPPGLQGFAQDGRFCRQVVRLAPETGFFVMPSAHPYDLPPLQIIRRPYWGMAPLPWQLEALGMPTTSGALLLWCDETGRFHSEQVGEGIDFAELWERNRRFIAECKKRRQ